MLPGLNNKLARANCWIDPFGRTGDAFSPAIAIPSITSRAISSQNGPTGMSAYFCVCNPFPGRRHTRPTPQRGIAPPDVRALDRAVFPYRTLVYVRGFLCARSLHDGRSEERRVGRE